MTDVPSPGRVQVHWAALPAGGLDDAARAALGADVDAATAQRLARMRRQEDRDRGLLGHALLRRLLGGVLSVPPDRVRLELRCGSCGSTEHGKPHLPAPAPVEFNLSHSGLVVAVALAPAGVPVGVDVEQVREVEWTTLRRNVFDDAEWVATGAAPDPHAARFAGWARKEAAVKATGHGLAMPLSEVPVAGAPAGGPWTAVLPDGAGTVAGRDVNTAGGHAGAVAAVVAEGASAAAPEVVVVREDVPEAAA